MVMFPAVFASTLVLEVARRWLLAMSLQHCVCVYARALLYHAGGPSAQAVAERRLSELLGGLGRQMRGQTRWLDLGRVRGQQLAKVYYRYPTWLTFSEWHRNWHWRKHHFEVSRECRLPCL